MECKIRGIGKVRVELKDGSSFVLHNVRYIPELKKNLISLGTFKKEGYTVKLQSGKVKVINGSRVTLSGIRRDNCVYSLDGHAMAGELNASVKEKDSLAQVWHKRLGHISEAGLQEGMVLYPQVQTRSIWKVQRVEAVSRESDWEEATCTAAYLINRLPSRAIEKKTPMEMWSGHPSDYEMLRIFGCVAYPHDKQGKLEPRAIKCALLGYPEGVNEYRLYRLDDESPKIVTSRNVIFNESVIYKDTLKDSGACDKEPRTRTKPLRFRDESNMVAYVFVAVEEDDSHEPLTYQEAVSYEDSSKWKAVMKEEMDSLRKNKTWELVDHPVGQKAELIYMRQPPGYEQGNKSLLKKKFDMKDLEEAKKILGMEIVRDQSRKIMRVTQSGDCDVERMSKVPYANGFGNLMYLMVCTRPDIAYAVSVVGRYLENPGKNYWEAVKWIFKYLRGTSNVGLMYGTTHGNHVDVTSFVDSDYIKDLDKGRSKLVTYF
nr:retrotransposon protein, putative, Ty1-copia subclass [Tanacetum cinerariifolium]GEZ36644.1 retrotransposon protein, putative, Ty1-copia subclass [Tanacetum cinerariifolium]